MAIVTDARPGESAGPDVVSERLAQLRARMAAAGGDPARIRVVAVTKGFGPAAVEAAAGAGLTDVGENYAQELLAKATALGPAGPAVRWHFLGPIQRNKVGRLAPVVSVWQALDRPAAADAVAAAAPGAPVLVQVNLADDPHRPGCSWTDVEGLVHHAEAAGLDVLGLMGVAPQAEDGVVRTAFARLARTARELGLPEVSMGMSDDLEAAVAEGSTLVRIGRALFGPRPDRNGVRR